MSLRLYLFDDGLVGAFDEHGDQVPELQRRREQMDVQVVRALLDARFFHFHNGRHIEMSKKQFIYLLTKDTA